ncbi:MAG: hypothetical protein HGB06_01635 [Chlorobaculum sp.]|jgi:hypothetical protein|nr:hypothetical protein [Chlorobaculum sp.]
MKWLEVYGCDAENSAFFHPSIVKRTNSSERNRGDVDSASSIPEKTGKFLHFHQFDLNHTNADIATDALFDLLADAFAGEKMLHLPFLTSSKKLYAPVILWNPDYLPPGTLKRGFCCSFKTKRENIYEKTHSAFTALADTACRVHRRAGGDCGGR